MEKINEIISRLEKEYPDARCMLNYSKDYELLIAVMLSAQTTDKAVNKVTEKLFKKYDTIDKLADASFDDVFEFIKALGLATTKTKNVLDIARKLKDNFNGKVPNTYDELLTLNGVGRKTCNVVLSELFNQDTFAVDTHVKRLSYRLGFSDENDSPLIVETKLKKQIPPGNSRKLHHLLIRHGREVCKAQNPACEKCVLRSLCTLKI